MPAYYNEIDPIAAHVIEFFKQWNLLHAEVGAIIAPLAAEVLGALLETESDIG